MKILIVEDNTTLGKELQQTLQEGEYLVEHVTTLAQSSERVALYQYDLIILDLGLPDGNGLELIPSIKQNRSNAGILIITAKDAIEDKVKGLEMGADDYITKPFHKAEVIARVKSILRRRLSDGQNIITVNDLSINTDQANASVNGTDLTLTKKEFELLLYFVYNKNRVLTKESIAEHLWGDHIDQSDNFDFIYNHIKNVRKKITSAGGVDAIKSVYGMGYKMIEK